MRRIRRTRRVFGYGIVSDVFGKLWGLAKPIAKKAGEKLMERGSVALGNKIGNLVADKAVGKIKKMQPQPSKQEIFETINLLNDDYN